MCTVVVDVLPGGGAHVLAVRDEDPGREWDPLGAWWPERGGIVGVRDRRAGGAWLAADPAAGRLSVLLNRADVLHVPADELLSRGTVVLESVAGRTPEGQQRTHGFNLVEVTDAYTRVVSWDGRALRTVDLAPGVHMIAHDDVDDRGTPRIARWLPEFEARAAGGGRAGSAGEPAVRPASGPGDWRASWLELLGRSSATSATDDRAIIRDNRPHGIPTQSLLYCTADVGPGVVDLSYAELPAPARWDAAPAES